MVKKGEYLLVEDLDGVVKDGKFLGNVIYEVYEDEIVEVKDEGGWAVLLVSRDEYDIVRLEGDYIGKWYISDDVDEEEREINRLNNLYFDVTYNQELLRLGIYIKESYLNRKGDDIKLVQLEILRELRKVQEHKN